MSHFPFLILHFSLILLLSSCVEEIPGCTDPSSPSYNPAATMDDGSCDFSIPTTYTFQRDELSSVSHETATVRQLLISDLALRISALGENGASAISIAELMDYYTLPVEDSLMIQTPVGTGLSKSDSAFTGIDADARLSEIAAELSGIFSPETEITEWFEYIAIQSQSAALGTPDVYTTAEGHDLSQLLPIALMGATLYNYALDSLLLWVDTLDNTDFLSGKRYSAMEHAWDQAFGYFGAAADYGGFSLEALAGEIDGQGNVPYVADSDEDAIIDFETEYNYLFARLAGKRDEGANGATDFGERLFDAFVLGRAAMVIGPGEESTILAARDEVFLQWENIIAATFVHHLNATLAHLNLLDTPDYDVTLFRKEWSAMYGYGLMLAYHPQSRLGLPATIQQDILQPLGSAPFIGFAGSPEYTAYLQTLKDVRALVGDAMGFSTALLEGW